MAIKAAYTILAEKHPLESHTAVRLGKVQPNTLHLEVKMALSGHLLLSQGFLFFFFMSKPPDSDNKKKPSCSFCFACLLSVTLGEKETPFSCDIV